MEKQAHRVFAKIVSFPGGAGDPPSEDEYIALGRLLKGAAEPVRRRKLLRWLAIFLARSSWSGCGVTLKVRGKDVTIAGIRQDKPEHEIHLPNPGWVLADGASFVIDMDAVPVFREGVAVILERVLLPLEQGEKLELGTHEPPELGVGRVEISLGKGINGTARHAGSRVRAMPLGEWIIRLRRAQVQDVAGILESFRKHVCPAGGGDTGLGPFLAELMSLGKRFGVDEGQRNIQLQIWRTILEMRDQVEAAIPGQTIRLTKIMMDVANRYIDTEKPKTSREAASAIEIWTTILDVYGAAQIVSDRFQQTVLTMMDIANKLIAPQKGKVDRDAGAAVAIWKALLSRKAALDHHHPGQLRIVALTMMNFANLLAGIRRPAGQRDVESAIQIWLTGMEHFQGVDIGEGDEAIRCLGTALQYAMLDRSLAEAFLGIVERRNPDLLSLAMSSELKYILGDYEAVIRASDAWTVPHPILLTVKADALRKLKRYDEARRVCEQALGLPTEAPIDIWTERARRNAQICLGYVLYEQGDLDGAESHFRGVSQTAGSNRHRSPRVLMGLAYIAERRGRVGEANDFARAVLVIDPENRKAKSFLDAH